MLMDVALVETYPRVEGKQAFLLLAPDPMKKKRIFKEQYEARSSVASDMNRTMTKTTTRLSPR